MTKTRSDPCDSLILEKNLVIGHYRILPRHGVSLSFVVRMMPGFQQANGPCYMSSAAFLGGRRRIFLMAMRTFGISEVAFIQGVAGCDCVVLHPETAEDGRHQRSASATARMITLLTSNQRPNDR